MKEYLRWFDSLMERSTLLLMDNFSAHELGYETFHGENATTLLLILKKVTMKGPCKSSPYVHL